MICVMEVCWCDGHYQCVRLPTLRSVFIAFSYGVVAHFVGNSVARPTGSTLPIVNPLLSSILRAVSKGSLSDEMKSHQRDRQETKRTCVVSAVVVPVCVCVSRAITHNHWNVNNICASRTFSFHQQLKTANAHSVLDYWLCLAMG